MKASVVTDAIKRQNRAAGRQLHSARDQDRDSTQWLDRAQTAVGEE